MKKVLFFVLAIAAVALTSCSNEEYAEVSENIEKPSAPTYVPPAGYNDFLHSLDSLNALYVPAMSRSIIYELMTYTVNSVQEALADNAGRIAGGYIGKHVGTAVGSVGGLGGALGGYVIGQWFGRCSGALLASFAFYKMHEKQRKGFAGRVKASSKSTEIDYYLPKDCISAEDSLGYIHNLVMAKMQERSDIYFDENGTPDYELMYNDCVQILKENGVYDEQTSEDPDFRNEIISYTKEIAELATESFSNQYSIEVYSDKILKGFESRNIPQEEIAIYADYATKMAETCVQLEINDKKEYADDLNDIISASDMPQETKSELRATTNMIVNSSICAEKME